MLIIVDWGLFLSNTQLSAWVGGYFALWIALLVHRASSSLSHKSPNKEHPPLAVLLPGTWYRTQVTQSNSKVKGWLDYLRHLWISVLWTATSWPHCYAKRWLLYLTLFCFWFFFNRNSCFLYILLKYMCVTLERFLEVELLGQSQNSSWLLRFMRGISKLLCDY